MSKKGLVIVNTGNGKGKTTAAIGLAVRALGHGLKVIMVQFIKGKWKTGEIKAADIFGDNFKIIPMGEGFTWERQDNTVDIKKAGQAFDFCCHLINSKKCDMLIMDEIHYAISAGLVPVDAILELIKQKPEAVHLVLTGRNAHPKIIESADLVTEMNEVKHPFKEGAAACKGIDF